MGIAAVIAILVVLILINALYVAAEFAIVAARKTRIAQKAEQGNRFAKMLHGIVSDPHKLDSYVAACQVGITLSSLVLGAIGQSNLPQHLSPLLSDLGGMQEAAATGLSATIILIVLTIGQMVLGELVPKSVALQMPIRMSMATVVPLRWSQAVLAPFIAVLNGSGNLVLRLMGQSMAGHQHVHSPDEIVMLIGESAEAGHLSAEDHVRLKRATQLSNLPVSQIMVPRTQVDAISVETPFDEVVEHLAGSPYTRIPVFESDRDDIVGILHTKDIVRLRESKEPPPPLRKLMRKVLIVPFSIGCQELLQRMRETGLRFAIVLDEFGGLKGFVTIDDLLSLLLGETADEYKADRPHAFLLESGEIRTDGRVSLREVSDMLGLSFQSSAATIGGLVTEVLGHTPDAGDVIDLPGCTAHVEALDGTVITSLLIIPKPPLEEEAEQ